MYLRILYIVYRIYKNYRLFQRPYTGDLMVSLDWPISVFFFTEISPLAHSVKVILSLKPVKSANAVLATG